MSDQGTGPVGAFSRVGFPALRRARADCPGMCIGGVVRLDPVGQGQQLAGRAHDNRTRLTQNRYPRPIPSASPFLLPSSKATQPTRSAIKSSRCSENFSGVQTLSLDRTLASERRMSEDEEIAAGEKARQYLQQSDASVLIWGSVLDPEHKIAKLFLTTSSAARQKSGQYQPEIGTTIRLPDVFWSDLAQVLRLAIASRDAEFRAKQGNYVADRLPPFIASVRRLLNESRGRPGWDADARGSTLVILADALQTLGDQSGQNAPLQEAVDAYRAALQELTRERVPLDWAVTQNNLGNALSRLGERESGTQRLEEAVDAYRAALQERTRERVPLRLGGDAEQPRQRASDARRAGERHGAAGGGGRRLSRGAAGTDPRAGAARLGDDPEQPRQRAFERWASGRAAPQRLEEAVEAYRAALQERTRERVPLRLGDDPEQPRQRASDARRAGERHRSGWRRRSRPIARRCRSGPASGCRCSGRRPRTTSATRFGALGERESGTAAAGGGGRRLPRGAAGADPRAGAAATGR